MMQSININFKMFLSEGTAEAWQSAGMSTPSLIPTRMLGQTLETKFPPSGKWLVLGRPAWDTGFRETRPVAGSRVGRS